MEKHLQGWKALIIAKYIEFSLSPYLPRTSKNSNINKEPCQFRPVYQLINFSLLGDCTTIAFSNFLKMLRCIVFTQDFLCDVRVNLISHALSCNSPWNVRSFWKDFRLQPSGVWKVTHDLIIHWSPQKIHGWWDLYKQNTWKNTTIHTSNYRITWQFINHHFDFDP